jgi:hypothetical protein
VQNKPRKRTTRPDPSLIKDAPVEDGEALDLDPGESEQAAAIIGDLSALAELASASASHNSPAATRARMMEPYAQKVFGFVKLYTFGVVVIVILQGFSVWDFALPTSVLIALVGSTAVAAFGLVKGVVGGLFAHP